MPHTNSLSELVFFYVGAVLYGHLPAVGYGLGAAGLLVLSVAAFGPRRASLGTHRWNLLLAATVLGLVAVSEAFRGNHTVQANIKLVCIPVAAWMLAAVVRQVQADRAGAAARRRAGAA